MSELTSTHSRTHGRPFPWYCSNCGRKEVRPAKVGYSGERTFEGRRYVIDLPELDVPRCGSCGQLLFSNTEIEAIARELRTRARLLHPEEVRAGREALGLSRPELSRRLGAAEDAAQRWEDGLEIQSRM